MGSSRKTASPWSARQKTSRRARRQPLTLTLEEGQYVIICNLPGHYEQGMYTGLKVT